MHTARRGFTLLEVMVGAAILAIAIMGLMAVLTATSRLQQSNRETTQALNAIRDTLEELRNYPNFNELSTASGGANQNEPLLRFYTQSGTNPRSGLPWDTFAVFGLNAAAAWSSSTDDARRVGLPLDLDADGATTTTNVNQDSDSNLFLDYVLLPVTVRLEWRSGTGSRALQVSTKLAQR